MIRHKTNWSYITVPNEHCVWFNGHAVSKKIFKGTRYAAEWYDALTSMIEEKRLQFELHYFMICITFVSSNITKRR